MHAVTPAGSAALIQEGNPSVLGIPNEHWQQGDQGRKESDIGLWAKQPTPKSGTSGQNKNQEAGDEQDRSIFGGSSHAP